MINGLRPYPDTKATGLPCLPTIPAHWESHRAKRTLREVDERSVRGDEELLSVSHITGVTPRNQKNVTMFMAESYEGHKLCRPADVVVNTMWAWMAAVGVSRQVGIVSPSYGVYRPRVPSSFVPRFLDYLLRTEVYRAQYVRASRGITTSRLRLYPEDFLGIPFVQPPIEEQRLIARFLDAHGALTARLIRAKQRIIKLLEEQKQAIIYRAVTRGLNPGVRLKPSSVPWLGDVPEHWHIRRLKQIARLQSGEGITALGIHEQGEFPVFGGNGLRGYTKAYTHDGDYILIGRQGALCGNINYATGRFWASEHAVAVHPKVKYATRWLGELLRVMKLNQYSISAAQPGLSAERIQPLPIPYPSFDEQQAIVRHIGDNTANIERGLTCVRDEVALLCEFRRRLVAEVVTGKLDVRAAAAALPEITEAEPIDEPIDGEDFEEALDDVENEAVAA